ncbi:MAG: tetratricopeptide repeat protein [Nitrosospira sp.]|nr:tetratricopeptide repeat protein [Nitrosospira sp.]
MFKVKRLVWVGVCVSVMGGCALYQNKNKQALSVKGVTDIKHTAGAFGAMYWLGRYYQGRGKYAEAIAAYEKALDANPSHVEAHNGLGISHFMQGGHQPALHHLRKAIELLPVATHLHNNLGYAHMMVRGHDGEAAAAFEEALRLDPENIQAHDSLMVVYERMGLHDKTAMLAMARPRLAAARPAMPGIAPGPTGIFIDSATVRETAMSSQHEMQYSTDARMVQVNPNLFELKLNQADPVVAILAANPPVKPQSLVNPESKDGLEVSNGSGMTGIASHVSTFLQKRGYTKVRLTDRPPFQQARTEIHYRTGNHVLADRINQMMPKQVPLVESYNLRTDIRVRVLLGKDVDGEVGYFGKPAKMQIAQRTGAAATRKQPWE